MHSTKVHGEDDSEYVRGTFANKHGTSNTTHATTTGVKLDAAEAMAEVKVHAYHIVSFKLCLIYCYV